ncbi:MAG TPA: flagellar motor protein MotA [Gammaproteobacteria bacterium]|nr:flagellar motor protein MotA [Gammaproteobacteria bacterium]
MNRLTSSLLLTLAVMISTPLYAQQDYTKDSAYKALDQLLKDVRKTKGIESQENTERLKKFKADKSNQARLLAEAKQEMVRTEERSDELKTIYDDNEVKLTELDDKLTERMGSLGEMFGVVRLIAGDTKGTFESSLVSTQLPGRNVFLSDLAERKELPVTDELDTLWKLLLEEMIESGKVVTYNANTINIDGKQEEHPVTRVGVFTAVTGGKFLNYLPETGSLVELGRQPARRFLGMASDLEAADSGMVAMAVDPSRGAIMALLVQAPSFIERIRQGGFVGYVILTLGAFGLLIVIWRFFVLTGLGIKIRKQLKSDEPSDRNPLGRVMKTYFDDQDKDTETMELKLDEAIIKETPRIENGLTFIKILAAVAPLLGLLGTVTGMIQTFQAITLFGTGDPKLMAGGISTALVTTVMGLIVAIPLVLLHSYLAGKSNALIQILDEQSIGLVARHAERKHV